MDNSTGHPAAPTIRVKVEKGAAETTSFSFRGPFRAGRDKTCEIHLSDPLVSRFHAEFWFADGKWWVLDLGSDSGTYLDGNRVDQAPLPILSRIALGQDGSVLRVVSEAAAAKPASEVSTPENKEVPVRDLPLEHYMEHYFERTDPEKVGEHTMMIRQAFKQVQKRQRKRFSVAILGLICLVLAAGAYALFTHREVEKQKALAQEIFYTMKALELEFAPILKIARGTQDAAGLEQIQHYRLRRKELERKYDRFVDSLEIYKKDLREEERVILHVARIFGECEVNMPEGFVKLVTKHIEEWKSTSRFKDAIQSAQRKGYIKFIVETLASQDLPSQFFYVALQESNFDINAVGPQTNFGIAKGMWQFIPATAERYGLRTGPLKQVRRPDPRDDRHDLEKSTIAAARYIRDIYDKDAQASGLLVMASYNWGERRVNRLIESMPENPQERNFWRLLMNYGDKIPKETYNYVLKILSAAVIGENPRLFGFDFDNPLDTLEASS
jgi:membrane-bound lytic murein transglycosylase D